MNNPGMLEGYLLAMDVARTFEDQIRLEWSQDLIEAMDRIAKTRWGWRWEKAKDSSADQGGSDGQ